MQMVSTNLQPAAIPHLGKAAPAVAFCPSLQNTVALLDSLVEPGKVVWGLRNPSFVCEPVATVAYKNVQIRRHEG